MRLLITVLLGLVLAAIVGVVASNSQGYILFNVADWTVRMSMSLFILTLLLAFVLVYFLLRFIINLLNLSQRYDAYREQKNLLRSHRYLVQGMKSLLEGDWRAADRALKKGVTYSKTPELNYLTAARAAQQLGDVDKRDEYLRLAHDSSSEDPLAVSITQAQLQLDQDQMEQALATLNSLYSRYPENLEVKRLLLKTHMRLQDWASVIRLLPEIQKQKVMDEDQCHAMRLQAYAGLLQAAGKVGDPQHLAKVWLEIPKRLRQEVYLIETLVQQRLQFAEHNDSETLLRKALSRRWDQGLVRLYGLVKGPIPAAQLKFAESQLSHHARDPVLLLTLGRLCIRNELWGMARTYLQESIEAQPNPEAYRELALLLQHLGEETLAANYFQKGLIIATEPSQGGGAGLLDKPETKV